jgi:hypothetical protein
LTALEGVRRVTKELAVIESEAVKVKGPETIPLVNFYAAAR